MTEFDPSKPVMTRGGAKVTLWDRRSKGRYPLVGVIVCDSGSEVAEQWTDEGEVHASSSVISELDLVNVPESKWMNVYEDPNITLCWLSSKEVADSAAATRGSRRIAITEWKASGGFITTVVEK